MECPASNGKVGPGTNGRQLFASVEVVEGQAQAADTQHVFATHGFVPRAVLNRLIVAVQWAEIDYPGCVLRLGLMNGGIDR